MKVEIISLAGALLLSLATPLAAQYRWVDRGGSVSYGDQPPADAKSVTRMDGRGRSTEDGVSALPYELRRAISQHPVTIYTAENCSPCEAARVYLRRRGVPYSEIVVETEEEASEMRKRVGVDSVPVMTLGRTPTIGFNEIMWSTALDAATYPKQSQLPVTYRQPPPQPLLPRAPAKPAEAAADSTKR